MRDMSSCPNTASIKLHEDIPNSYRVMANIRKFGEKSKGHNSKTKKRETISLVCDMLS